MRFKKANKFVLMEAGRNRNGFEINEDVIEESIINHAFDGAPIVFNESQSFTDYRNDEDVEKFIKEKMIGVVIPGTVDFNSFDVFGDVMLQEEFANRTHFDNWCIEYDKDYNYRFKYISCELFDKKEDTE